jgi:hypothetical protein
MPGLHAASSSFLVSVLALGAGACSAPPEDSPRGLQTIDLDAEAASFFVFHPDDLQHREASPHEWVLYEFALAPEFAAGNLVAFDTGADGTYRLRLTRGELTARERAYASSSWDFRYRVRHGRVLVDTGEFLPSDSTSDLEEIPPGVAGGPGTIPAEQWYAIPNGDYRVTVHAIDWEREPGAVGAGGDARKSALPAYVIRFQPVKRLDSIEATTCPPRLEPGPAARAEFHPVSVDRANEESTDEPLPGSCRVLVAPTLTVVPGFETELITVPATEVARSQPDPEHPPEFEPAIVLVDSEQVPRVGALCSVGRGVVPRDGGPWKVAFHVRRLVRVTAITRRDGRLSGEITGFARPPSEVSPEDVAALRSAFASHAKSSSDYRTRVKHPDYEAERVTAIRSIPVLSAVFLHHVQMPPATRARLLPLSDAERFRELLPLLAPPGPVGSDEIERGGPPGPGRSGPPSPQDGPSAFRSGGSTWSKCRTKKSLRRRRP